MLSPTRRRSELVTTLVMLSGLVFFAITVTSGGDLVFWQMVTHHSCCRRSILVNDFAALKGL